MNNKNHVFMHGMNISNIASGTACKRGCKIFRKFTFLHAMISDYNICPNFG